MARYGDEDSALALKVLLSSRLVTCRLLSEKAEVVMMVFSSTIRLMT